MQTSFERNTLVLLGIFTLFIVSPVSAQWNINILDQPYSFQNVSNATNTVQMIELTDGSGTTINESQLTGSSYVEYDYNGSTEDMIWLNNGYWYADFKLNNTGGEVLFAAQGETESSLIGDSTTEVNETRSFNLGNMSVDLMNDFSEPVNPEKTFDIQINVTDTVNNTFEDEADVDFYLTNGSWTSDIYDVNNMADENNDGADDHYKNFGLEFDLKYNSDYLIHVNATNSSNLGYNDSYGVQSITLETLPEIKGNIVRLNTSSGCDSESFFTECQRDTTIGTGFNITSATAENVNLTLQLKNSTSGNWSNHSTTELSKENDVFSGEIEVPDINTSKYDKKFRLQYNASNSGREEIVNREVTYKDFKIVDKSDAVTGKGSYRVKLEIRKYFTPELLTDSRINDSQIAIDQPSGDSLTEFTVEDMDRLEGSGHFKKKISVPLDSETGIYEMSVQVTNLYNEVKSETFSFNVTEVQQTFTLNNGDDDFEKTINKTGNHTFNVTVENDVSSEVNLSTSISGDIDEFTEVNSGENISLDSEESKNVSIRFNISSVDEYDGEIKFSDETADYNSTLDVEINQPTCSYRNSTVCVLGAGLNASSDETGNVTKDFTAINVGEKNQSYTFSFSLSGNVTDYANVEPNETTLNTENDSEIVDLNYSVTTPGFYSGTLEIDNEEDTIKIPVSLDSNVEATSTGIEIPDSIELGDIEEEGSASSDIEVENTGDVEISSVEVSSNDYTVSTDSVTIASGSTETLSLEFSEITSESGQINITGETSSGSVYGIISVSASVIPDYGKKADEFEQRVIDLDSQVSSDSEYQTELNNVQSSISDLRSAHRQDNYDRAQTLSTQIQNTLDSVELEVTSSQQETDPNTDQTNDSGGIPILPIAAAILVILIVGFVAFTSIEFEKGDPLYNVLGK